MHGEYKTPGGKLVVVDFEVIEGRFQRVEVSGDFFLYPEETLEAITGALEGANAEQDDGELAASIQFALPAGAELLGTSPGGIAIAVRRALTAAPEGTPHA